MIKRIVLPDFVTPPKAGMTLVGSPFFHIKHLIFDTTPVREETLHVMKTGY
jgi:hypothetical protein